MLYPRGLPMFLEFVHAFPSMAWAKASRTHVGVFGLPQLMENFGGPVAAGFLILSNVDKLKHEF